MNNIAAADIKTNIRVWFRIVIILVVGGLTGTPALHADEPAEDAAKSAAGAFFESNVRPLLISRCTECHGADKQKGNLRLDSLAAILEGGDSGPALVPGKPEESFLVEVVGYAADLKMPPRSKLPDDEIAALTTWVKNGAVWPNAKPVTKPKDVDSGPLFTEEEQDFWAFRPPQKSPIPTVNLTNWAKSPLDHFILHRLEAAGLQPAPEADKRTWIRRATFDLIGLPPTPEEVDRFLEDNSPEAFANVIDRLLASPHYGERWGRRWLDLARYADSNGLDENLAYVNAFRFRDYVVAAFNQDLPYDAFVREQIAGDLLPSNGIQEQDLARVTATGFLSLGAKMLAEDDPVKMQMDIIDEQVDTIGRAFLGLTLGCARCHDHKFDPIPTADYYSLAGIFKSTKTMENFNVVAAWQERPLATTEAVAAQEAHRKKIDAQKAAIARFMQQENANLIAEARQQSANYLLAAARTHYLDLQMKDAKPLGNDPEAAKLVGIQMIEAESFVRGNALKTSEGYGEGIGVILNKGELPNVAEYDIEIPEAGFYRLEIRYAAAGARPNRLLINGSLVKSDVAGQVTGSWNPDTQKWFLEGFFSLDAGNNILRIERDGPFPHIDKLLIAPVNLGTTGSPILALKTLGDDRPKDGIVRQWIEAIQRTDDATTAPLNLWRACVAAPDKIAETIQAAPAPWAELFAGTEPTLTAVANRYGELFKQAANAWEALKKTPEGQKADALTDPAQEALRQLLYAPKGPFAVPPTPESYYAKQVSEELAKHQASLKELEESLPQLPLTMAVSESKPENLKIHLRGSHLTLGEEAPRQFLQIIAGEAQSPLPSDQSGRLQLAEWLTNPDHPLTARVMVNRVWQGHFGQGLVRSPDNFGRLGERPTHPELLDWLALQFIEQGWSLKSLHRMIMLSATYRMSTTYNDQAAQIDPENRLWWRMNRRRLEAEAIRDGILAVCGTLDTSMGGSQLLNKPRQYVTSTANVNPVVYNNTRRSIYLPVIRSALYEVFQAFDFADPSVLTGTRETTTVAPQALFMMNSELMSKQTRTLAETLLADDEMDDTGRIHAITTRAFSRPATTAEISRALDYLSRYQAALVATEITPNESRIRAWQSLARALLGANEFVYVE